MLKHYSDQNELWIIKQQIMNMLEALHFENLAKLHKKNQNQVFHKYLHKSSVETS